MARWRRCPNYDFMDSKFVLDLKFTFGTIFFGLFTIKITFSSMGCQANAYLWLGGGCYTVPPFYNLRYLVSQGVYQWPSRGNFFIIIWKSNELLTLSYRENIFRKNIDFSFQTKNCYNSAKNGKIEFCFFCKHPIFDSTKIFLCKIGCNWGSRR